ncbi:MAG TPA: hypothetical protein VK933_13425 [Longimicrobiales bacterium]|nr:hypothetical protein [Longimicrobiales bacterium]
MVKSIRFARRALTGIPLILAGCLSTTEPPETLFWEGELVAVPDGPAGLAGPAAMVALQSQTRVGVGLTGAPDGATYGWLLLGGTCAAPREAVAPASAFPALQVSDGGVDAEAVIQRRLTGTDYAVQVVENSDGTGAVLACADLTRT